MGETEYWDEFIAPGDTKGSGRIEFGKTWDYAIDFIHNSAKQQDLSLTAHDSHLKNRFDLKNQDYLAQYGPMTGRLLDGKYASARSAGNYTAGYNARTGTFQGFHISHNTYMKLAGALNVKKCNSINAGKIVLFGISYGPAPYYGEDAYSGRMIDKGWYSKRK